MNNNNLLKRVTEYKNIGINILGIPSSRDVRHEFINQRDQIQALNSKIAELEDKIDIILNKLVEIYPDIVDKL